ncbi:hypothetical protein IQ235_12300 [Oscillatoriales cyanobacterium LEGE 11467]|uniref:Tetratricopeptide repeat protein n=1 Tax=Zarconia navalis LEGE 11467 TaxID=1828826 RepID=A0A928ZAB8_9CYAN|nr:hypothetical protein [Zarconia navalis]MBE9041561.1 hypothetical protein [Zarconia navalis LEGE 11467]
MKLLHKTLGTVALIALFNAIVPSPAFGQQVTPSDTSVRVVGDDFVVLATAAMADGDYHNAAYHANKALEIDETLADAYFLRGQAFSYLGERDAAIADLERAADLYLAQDDRVGYQAAVDTLSGV